MTKLLEETLRKVRELPASEQDRLAAILLSELESAGNDSLLSREQQAELRRRLARPAAFATESEVEAFFRKNGG